MDEVIETTNEAAEDVNVFIQYLQDHIPNLISFAIEIVLALIFFFLGRIMIKWIRKLVRKMLEKSNVDMVEQMTAMMSSQRALQSAAQSLKMYDQIMSKSVSDVGRL